MENLNQPEQTGYDPITDPSSLGLDPDNNPSHKMLLDSAHYDYPLYEMIIEQERLGKLHSEGETIENYREKMQKLGEQISQRGSYIVNVLQPDTDPEKRTDPRD